jgi:hypothetical protein
VVLGGHILKVVVAGISANYAKIEVLLNKDATC